MKVYAIAGEASGDLHGANLFKELLNQSDDLDVRFWGGDKMEEVIHKKPVKHYKDLAFMGFVEVLMNIRTILKNISFCKKDILAFKPDVLILIDYPGFNLRIAKWAKEQGIKVYYYISPQVWAWKKGRVHTIKEVVDHMTVILPFEVDFYKSYEYPVQYFGHPLIDEIKSFRETALTDLEFRSKWGMSNKPIIAILPGSRKQEVKKKLPIMLGALKKYSEDFELVLAATSSLNPEVYESIAHGFDLKVVCDDTYNLLNNAHSAVVTSGTATLETALFKVPEVVCYIGSRISYEIAKRVITIKYISLVNLIVDRPLVKELIQKDLTIENLQMEVDKIIAGPERTSVLEGYDEIENILGEKRVSKAIANEMLTSLREKV